MSTESGNLSGATQTETRNTENLRRPFCDTKQHLLTPHPTVDFFSLNNHQPRAVSIQLYTSYTMFTVPVYPSLYSTSSGVTEINPFK